MNQIWPLTDAEADAIVANALHGPEPEIARFFGLVAKGPRTYDPDLGCYGWPGDVSLEYADHLITRINAALQKWRQLLAKP